MSAPIDDAVNIDVLIILVTSPIWITYFAGLIAGGWWAGRKERRARG